MCGIIACVGTDDAVDRLITGLENLEYRGYDSAGIAVKNGHGVSIYKQSGQISDLKNTIVQNLPDGEIGIGHTRWSTHGPPTDENAHPHTAESERVAVVHNGIIENYEELKSDLRARGHEFESDTDTEVIPHLIEGYMDEGADAREAFERTIDSLEGSYATVALVEGHEKLLATRQDSPLVLGQQNGEYYLASDVPAFLEFTNQVSYLEDGDVAEVSAEGATITDADGEEVSRDVETVEWDPEETGKGAYDHFMLKEIDSQPESLRKTIQGRVDPEAGEVTLDALEEADLEGVEQVHLVACGTSYHAAMFGSNLMNRRGIPATAHRANEYTDTIPVDGNTLTIAVTQSGETADTLTAIRRAEKKGAQTLAVTNVIGSTVAREVDTPVYIRAGPEIGVAATKTFSSQAVTLSLLAEHFADDLPQGTPREDREEFLAALERLPEDIQRLLDTTEAERLSRHHLDKEAFFFIGHELNYSVALEGALKFKEITYEHAEGFPSGGLKHGPLALVTPETTIFTLLGSGPSTQTRSNAEEARARGANIVTVAPESVDVDDVADERLTIPDTHPDLSSLLANIQLQLVSYYTARQLERPIDKPRNLAKSVTVR
ncbi:glutamine--fructose-6-phosphate transaminase (isomerizing) [Haloarcula nitratireducens]|uniref:Glutamine--fructose-6-phosphate aminotransferase [isomerizing] n=1 Tax=Haloarcula nitratireducens TaxID=2487749 RepID=A0AAW4PDP9_9EURY|nr:glutamine--fructose-6-phosphate transaminase (isomerizing) [Halomicroarcula nitratireducens]MBX0295773.1 glutamine--fructose-6-phosphate transaminase (isomerizing) [Halomicroarcula nitratireducens]